MTAPDPWDGPACERCKGKGEIVFTRGNHWMSVKCTDCHGTGHADTPDPVPLIEDGTEYDPDVHGPLPAVWEHPAVADLPTCPQCMGAGTVIGLGDMLRGQRTGKLLQAPCPRCSPGGA